MSIPVPPPAPAPPHPNSGMQQQFVPQRPPLPNTSRPEFIGVQQGSLGHGNIPPGPSYEGWTFRKAEPVDPNKKKTWSHYVINQMHLPEEDLMKQVTKQIQKKELVWDQYRKLEPRRQIMIDNLVEKRKLDEKDRKFEWKLVSVKTEERKVGRQGYETASIHVILKRQLRPIVTNERVGNTGLHHDLPRVMNDLHHPRQHQEQSLPIHSAFAATGIRPDMANQIPHRGEPRELLAPMPHIPNVPQRSGPPPGLNNPGHSNPHQNGPQHPTVTMQGGEPPITVLDNDTRSPSAPQYPPAGPNGPARQQTMQPHFQTAQPQQRPQSRNGDHFIASQPQNFPQQRGRQPPVVSHQQPRPPSRNDQVPPILPQQNRSQSRNGHHARSSDQSHAMPQQYGGPAPQRASSLRRPGLKQRRVARWVDSSEEGTTDSDEHTEAETEFTEDTSLDDELDFQPVTGHSRRGSLNQHHSRFSHHEHGVRRDPIYREHARIRATASSDPAETRYMRADCEIIPEVNRARLSLNPRRQSFVAREARPALTSHSMSYHGDRFNTRELPNPSRGLPHGFHGQPTPRRLSEAPYTAAYSDEYEQQSLRQRQLRWELERMEALDLNRLEAAENWDRSRMLEQEPRLYLDRDRGPIARDRFGFGH